VSRPAVTGSSLECGRPQVLRFPAEFLAAIVALKTASDKLTGLKTPISVFCT
jgi:hypothetical protein